jgi:prepilin-type N-terminal cleavage/methylation domain-containing protein
MSRRCRKMNWEFGSRNSEDEVGPESMNPVFRVPNSEFLRRGMTLLELVLALGILSMIMLTLAGLAKSVESASDYTAGQDAATQSARVVLDRIQRMVEESAAADVLPGAMVLNTQVGTWQLPSTLLVWHPTRSATNPRGKPRDATGPCYDELVIYCPDPTAPQRLLEVTVPGDPSKITASDATAWASVVTATLSSTAARKVVLTDLLRTVQPPTTGTALRGMVRFVVRLRPSADDWTAYRNTARTGTAAAEKSAWQGLLWAQSICGDQTGLRQVWVRTELQLQPGTSAASRDTTGNEAIGFFGSAALYYSLTRGA